MHLFVSGKFCSYITGILIRCHGMLSLNSPGKEGQKNAQR